MIKDKKEKLNVKFTLVLWLLAGEGKDHFRATFYKYA